MVHHTACYNQMALTITLTFALRYMHGVTCHMSCFVARCSTGIQDMPLWLGLQAMSWQAASLALQNNTKDSLCAHVCAYREQTQESHSFTWYWALNRPENANDLHQALREHVEVLAQFVVCTAPDWV